MKACKACKYGVFFPNINIQIDSKLYFLIVGLTIANQASL